MRGLGWSSSSHVARLVVWRGGHAAYFELSVVHERLEHGLIGSYQGDQTAMSKRTVKNNPILKSQQVLNALIAIVRPYLPLDLRNTRITAEDIIAVLGYASVHRVSMDAACNELKEAPSGNRLREVLAQALPDREITARSIRFCGRKRRVSSRKENGRTTLRLI